MKKKLGLLLVSLVLSFAYSVAVYAQPMVNEESALEGNSYMTIERASGEVEVYALDEELLGLNMIAADDITVVENVLEKQEMLVGMDSNTSLIQPLASSYTFDWTIQGGYIGYANRKFNLKKGDTVSFTVAVGSGFSIEIGLYDNNGKEFISSGYWGSTDAWSIGDSFTTTKDLNNVSFAINNLQDESQTFVGSYTIP